jgi:NADH-quinone oxidoreductase subunit J
MVASAVFFIAMALSVITLNGSYQPNQQSISAISQMLFNAYVIPFELLSVVLVGGIIGMFHTAEDEE